MKRSLEMALGIAGEIILAPIVIVCIFINYKKVQ